MWNTLAIFYTPALLTVQISVYNLIHRTPFPLNDFLYVVIMGFLHSSVKLVGNTLGFQYLLLALCDFSYKTPQLPFPHKHFSLWLLFTAWSQHEFLVDWIIRQVVWARSWLKSKLKSWFSPLIICEGIITIVPRLEKSTFSNILIQDQLRFGLHFNILLSGEFYDCFIILSRKYQAKTEQLSIQMIVFP